MAGTHLSIRIDLASGDRIGPGKIALLEAIRSTGSISAAARSIGMSYRRAWLLVEEINRYRPGKIVLMNGDLGHRMISGTFHLDHLDDFIGQARGLFGASVRSLPGGIVLLT